MTENKEFNLKFNLNDEKSRKTIIFKYIVYFILVILLYGVISLSALSTYSSNANTETSHYFFENSPDLIAVFTGDKGRLEYAFSLLAKYPECKLLISGVYSKNTLLSLIQLKK